MSSSSSPSSTSVPSKQCSTTITPSIGNCRRWQHTTFAVVLCTLLALSHPQPSHAFSMTMMAAYKPPVKSSVSKIRNNRYSSSSGSISNPQAQNRPSSRSTTQKSAYVGALAPPTTQQQQRPRRSFESRMRDLVLGQPKQQSTTTSSNKAQGARSLPANVFTAESLQDYKKIVGEEREKLVAVRFFAPWCRACKAMAPIFYHLANKHQDVVFVDVPVTPQNTAWCMQGLGVQSLPYGHIYDPQNGGLVEELCVTKKHMAEFEQKLESRMDSRQRRGNNGSNVVDDETSSSS